VDHATDAVLASVRLEFTHPATGETMSFSADIPEHMREFIEKAERLHV
jgi:hypothetical protein